MKLSSAALTPAISQTSVAIAVTVVPETVHLEGIFETQVTAPVPDPPLVASVAD